MQGRTDLLSSIEHGILVVTVVGILFYERIIELLQDFAIRVDGNPLFYETEIEAIL